MKRWLLAVALLFSALVGVAQADYILIIANLGLTKDKTSAPTTGPGGGGEGGGGRGGAPQGPGGFPGGGGEGGRGGAGVPSAGGGTTFFPGGDLTLPVEDLEPTPMRIVAVVEVTTRDRRDYDALASDEKLDQFVQTRSDLPTVMPKWGGNGIRLFSKENGFIEVKPLAIDNKHLSTVRELYAAKNTALVKAGKTVEKCLDLAYWCLQRGLLKEFVQLMTDVGELDSKHPNFLAFRKVQTALNRPTQTNPLVASLNRQKLLEEYKPASLETGHHTLLQNLALGNSSNNPDVTSRLQHMEDAYRSFFYWFALKTADKDGNLPIGARTKDGRDVIVPEERLIAVVVADPKEFRRQERIYEPLPLASDGFLARHANIAVYSNSRLEHHYHSLLTIAADVATAKERERLLKGGAASIDLQLPHNQTLALMLKALDEEASVASSSHETTRQLVRAVGLLPRDVIAPEWLDFGMGSFFETPKGSPWQTVTGPSPLYLPQFKKWAEQKKLDPVLELRNTVTDRYFRAGDGGRNQAALLKARTMSWALTYYLANHHFNSLLRYYGELSRLPRDLEPDEDTLKRCFGRAFDLLDPANPNELAEGPFKEFAGKWYGTIIGTSMEGEELIKLIHRLETEATTSKPTGAAKP